ncbi:glycosyltransferase [Amaricoccus macauensis]|uniref:glycosyltransferase n=1 Tax=Amaricoccus macauensis TaxID=57001 RepID=UPI003C7D143C
MKTEIIIATYNSPRPLLLTLTSILQQEERPDSVCIADDGSGPETAEALERFRGDHPDLPLRHVWHEDRGFEKWAIVNQAIASSEADFLILLDGDVMIHPTFVGRHLAMARRGRFSTGSLIRLGPETTSIVTEEMVRKGLVFDIDWLRAHGAIDRLGTWLKTMPFPQPVMGFLDRVTPVQKALCGANASFFREDALRVNGFDESIRYGGGDKEFGIRLANAGISGQHLRYSAPLVHLDHPRSYKNADEIRKHRELIARAKTQKITWTENGIEKRDAKAEAAE